MLRKKIHHYLKNSPRCGEIIEILSSRDCSLVDISVVLNIGSTKGHYHKKFHEIYFVMDGHMTLGLYDPTLDLYAEHVLDPHELMVIDPGVHHKVLHASEQNRICVISLPGFDPNDEHLSDKF